MKLVGRCMLARHLIINRQYVHTQVVKNTNKITPTSDPFHPKATEVIDVRTPDEFKIDHIPGAINLPVLNNTEREEVGKLYSTDPFKARKNGAKLVVSNITEILDSHILNMDKDYRPLIYCWRGGQRSRSLATILSEIGFDVFVLEGGYKTYRKQVVNDLKTLPEKYSYRVITGLTGSGKTHILTKLSEFGEQVLDLEGLAKHKGSMLGRFPEDQPSNQYFWTLIREKLASFDPSKIVWIESESRKIGNCVIPNVFFDKMSHAKRFYIQLPMKERVQHIIKDYPHWTEDSKTLYKILEYLRKHCGNSKVDHWKSLVEKRDWESFVESLLIHHYDPTYTVSQIKNQLTDDVVKMEIPNLNEDSLHKLVQELIKLHNNFS